MVMMMMMMMMMTTMMVVVVVLSMMWMLLMLLAVMKGWAGEVEKKIHRVMISLRKPIARGELGGGLVGECPGASRVLPQEGLFQFAWEEGSGAIRDDILVILV